MRELATEKRLYTRHRQVFSQKTRFKKKRGKKTQKLIMTSYATKETEIASGRNTSSDHDKRNERNKGSPHQGTMSRNGFGRREISQRIA